MPKVKTEDTKRLKVNISSKLDNKVIQGDCLDKMKELEDINTDVLNN